MDRLPGWIPNCPYGPQDLKGTLAQELDFENEGRNAERCARELQHFRHVVVPRVHWGTSSKVGWAPPGGAHVHWGTSSKVGWAPLGRGALTPALSQRVLTAEFYEGCKVNDVEAIQSMGLAVQDVSAVSWAVGLDWRV